ncbi:MAG: HAD-IA family hydrolase [Patescibacteria group bacterium]|jgi:HAD superfamily hydrolase (TIGR01509 family)
MKTMLVDAVDTFIIEGEGIFTEMQKLLDEYPNPKIILTNANDEQMLKFGLDKMPYPVFTLKHQPDKVDPEYFKKMLENFHFTPEDVIYFEHNAKAVESARSIGIDSYHYDMGKKDLIALKRFLESYL